MDDLLRYASLAGAGLPAHERHRAKSTTVHQLRRVRVENNGLLDSTPPLACRERDDLATRVGLAFSAGDKRRNDYALRCAADTGHRAPVQAPVQAPIHVPVGTAPARKARKLILLAF